jgi:hypothetical protein
MDAHGLAHRPDRRGVFDKESAIRAASGCSHSRIAAIVDGNACHRWRLSQHARLIHINEATRCGRTQILLAENLRGDTAYTPAQNQASGLPFCFAQGFE